MKVLVINTGSSSIKFQLFNMKNETIMASGLAEQIGEPTGRIKFHTYSESGEESKYTDEDPLKDHSAGLNKIAKMLTDKKTGVIKDYNEIDAVGHRAVHGGEKFKSSAVIDEKFISAMKEMIPLAPLHNPPNLKGIEVAQEIFPAAKQVGVFDTAFHQTMPEHAFRYALPEEFYQKYKIRRYGFHGTSHLFVSKAAANYLNKPVNKLNAISVHIGNGASIAAIKDGKSIDTSMGLTPLEGLIMGTRSGDIDPAIPYFLATNNKMEINEINNLLNKQSGMKGITGMNDLREIEENYKKGDKTAILALEMYAYRIKKYIGSYYAALGELDTIIFTAGVGENSDIVRGLACSSLENLGIVLDPEKNQVRGKGIREIQKEGQNIKILVVPTNEELEIAQQTVEVINNNS